MALWKNIVAACSYAYVLFFFSSRRRHTRFDCDWSSDVCSSDLGLDLVRRRGADRLVIAVANHEIVFHDSPERRQRQQMRDHGRAVLAADIEHQDRKSVV